MTNAGDLEKKEKETVMYRLLVPSEIGRRSRHLIMMLCSLILAGQPAVIAAGAKRNHQDPAAAEARIPGLALSSPGCMRRPLSDGAALHGKHGKATFRLLKD